MGREVFFLLITSVILELLYLLVKLGPSCARGSPFGRLNMSKIEHRPTTISGRRIGSGGKRDLRWGFLASGFLLMIMA